MNAKTVKDINISDNLLLEDSNYYKYIFKKTEKISCVIFYIIGQTNKGHNNVAKSALEYETKRTLDVALQTLAYKQYSASASLYELMQAFVGLGSTIRLAQAALFLEKGTADILLLELDSVMRSLKQYLVRSQQGLPLFEDASTDRSTQVSEQKIKKNNNSALVSNAKKTNRTVRQDTIKDILSSKGQITIKDISDKLPQLSEKTVQRELNTLIEEGIVVKEGERRWSKYSLAFGS